MTRFAFKMQLKAGCEEEYQRRHRTIWPELVQMIKRHSIGTAIQAVKTQKINDGVMYNLAGQKVDASYKGVVIVNGKKVLNK